MSKHITFISSREEYSKNDDFLKNKLLKKWNNNVYSHIFEDDTNTISNANLVVLFGETLLRTRFPDKGFGKFFYDENQQIFTTLQNYKDHDKLTKAEIREKTKEIREKINHFFSRLTLIRVTDLAYFYRDIDFKKIKGKNPYRADFKFIEDPNGEFLSYDGKKLRKVSKDFQTFSPTYEEHLRAKDLFYFEEYPMVTHTKLLHYLTFDIETNLSLDTIDTPEPIISIVGYSNIYNKNFVWLLKKRPDQTYDKEKFLKDKIFEFEDEQSMLDHFWKTCSKLEIDLLGSWNGDFFDIPYLVHRCKKLGVGVEQFLPELYETIGKDGELSYYCHEIILWDYLRYLKWIVIDNKPISWTLDAVAQHLFGEKKMTHGGTDTLWEKDDLTELIQYNLHDVYLTEKIAQTQKIIEFPILYQKIAPQTYENVYFNSRFLETLIHHKYPSNWNFSNQQHQP